MNINTIHIMSRSGELQTQDTSGRDRNKIRAASIRSSEPRNPGAPPRPRSAEARGRRRVLLARAALQQAHDALLLIALPRVLVHHAHAALFLLGQVVRVRRVERVDRAVVVPRREAWPRLTHRPRGFRRLGDARCELCVGGLPGLGLLGRDIMSGSGSLNTRDTGLTDLRPLRPCALAIPRCRARPSRCACIIALGGGTLTQ